MKFTKKDDEFLPSISRENVQKMYKKEKDSKAKLRLLASILRKEGKTLAEISVSIQKPIMTISDWLKGIEKDGLKRIYDVKQSGRPSLLTEDELKKLKEILIESPEKQGIPFKVWTTSLVQYLINKMFDVLYKVRNVLNIVRKLGFSFKIPRQENIKKNNKLVEKFKKNSKEKYGIIINVDSRSSVLTKCISR